MLIHTNHVPQIMDREESRYRSNQAVMIDELEATIPSFCYSSSWMPRYVHFLQRENDTDDDGQQSEGQKGSAGVYKQLLGAACCCCCCWCCVLPLACPCS